MNSHRLTANTLYTDLSLYLVLLEVKVQCSEEKDLCLQIRQIKHSCRCENQTLYVDVIMFPERGIKMEYLQQEGCLYLI